MTARFKALDDLEDHCQNKRGGRPMLIKIPKGSIGVQRDGKVIFVSLHTKWHTPFIFCHEIEGRLGLILD